MSFTVRWTEDALVDLDGLYGSLLPRNEAAARKALAAVRHPREDDYH